MAPDAAVDAATLRKWVFYVLLPAVVGAVVYWFVSDATIPMTAVFGAVMIVMILAMDHFFDTIPRE